MSEMSFEEIIGEFKSRRTDASKNGRQRTGELYSANVRKWKSWLAKTDRTIWEADHVDLREWVEELSREGYAPTSLRGRLSSVSKFYQDLHKMDEGRRHELPETPPPNPYDGLDKETKDYAKGKTKKSEGMASEEKIYYLSPDEVDELVEHAPSPRGKYELMFKLMFTTGLRVSELAKIKLRHVSHSDNSIYIPAGKSPEDRRVWYGGSDASYVKFNLDRWMDVDRASVPGASNSEYLFPTQFADHTAPETIGMKVHEAAENAGLQEVVGEYADGREIHKITPHTLRHSFAMQAIKSGIDVRSLMGLMGHEKLETTLIYLKIAEKDQKRAAMKFSPHTIEEDNKQQSRAPPTFEIDETHSANF